MIDRIVAAACCKSEASTALLGPRLDYEHRPLHRNVT